MVAVRPESLEGLPAIFNLADLGHIRHGAASVQVRQDDLLILAAEDVGAFGHEMNAAEDDVFGAGFGGDLRELVGVAGKVSKSNNFVALVVVAEEDGGGAEARARGRDAVVHGVVGEREVVIERAGVARRFLSRRCDNFSQYAQNLPPSVQLTLRPDGDVESNSWLQWIRCAEETAPNPRGCCNPVT